MTEAVNNVEAPAKVKPRKNKHHALDRRTSYRRSAFARAYATPGTDTHHNGKLSAIAAGYSPNGAAATASDLLTDANVRAEVDRLERKFADRLEIKGALNLEKIQQGHVDLMERCLAKNNVEVATRNWEDLGKTIGAYSDRVDVDVTVQFEWNEREAIEAHAISRIRLEQAGAAGLGVSGPVIEAESRLLEVGHEADGEGQGEPKETPGDNGRGGDRRETRMAVEPDAGGPGGDSKNRRDCAGDAPTHVSEQGVEGAGTPGIEPATSEPGDARSDNGESVAQDPPPEAPERRSDTPEGDDHNG